MVRGPSSNSATRSAGLEASRTRPPPRFRTTSPSPVPPMFLEVGACCGSSGDVLLSLTDAEKVPATGRPVRLHTVSIRQKQARQLARVSGSWASPSSPVLLSLPAHAFWCEPSTHRNATPRAPPFPPTFLPPFPFPITSLDIDAKLIPSLFHSGDLGQTNWHPFKPTSHNVQPKEEEWGGGGARLPPQRQRRRGGVSPPPHSILMRILQACVAYMMRPWWRSRLGISFPAHRGATRLGRPSSRYPLLSAFFESCHNHPRAFSIKFHQQSDDAIRSFSCLRKNIWPALLQVRRRRVRWGRRWRRRWGGRGGVQRRRWWWCRRGGGAQR